MGLVHTMYRSTSLAPTLRRKRRYSTAFRSYTPATPVVVVKRGSKRTYTKKKLNTGHSGQELKHFDNSQAASNISATGAQIAVDIFDVVQGLTDQTRIGRKITVKKFQLRYIWTQPSAVGTGDGDSCRLIVGIDHQCNGAVPTTLDILETADHLSYYNLANSDRFTIIHDKQTQPLDPTAGGPASTTTTRFSSNGIYTAFSKVMNLDIEYDATAGVVTDLTSNNFFILAITRLAAADIKLQWRFRYTD